MNISSDFVGRKSKPLKIIISERDAMNYCAGCYITNPIFFDDRKKLLVFPMFVVSLTWKISSSFEQYWDTTGFPLEVLNTQVHYFEDLVWYKNIYGGDTITILGEVVAIILHISGSLLCIEYKGYSDKGMELFKEVTCSLLRSVKCVDKGIGKEKINVFNLKFHNSPKPLWEELIEINPYDTYVYDGCSNIHFPIHTSNKFAVSVGLPAPIYQGTAILSRILQKFLEKEYFAPEKKFVKSIQARFASYVLPGSRLNIKVFEYPKGENSQDIFFFEVYDLSNKPVVKEGKVEFVDTTQVKEG